MAHKKNPKDTEVDAYSYIKTELGNLGWIVKNPARVIEGEVYKQNECLANEDIAEAFGEKRPEAMVKLNEIEFWVIESKRTKDEIDDALDEAKNYYAKRINNKNKIKCLIATGIAGNDTDGYTIINQYLNNGKWETILFNGKTKDTLLSKQQAEYIIKNKTINYQDFPDFPEEKYFTSAEKINGILHNAGVNKNKRARFIAGLILSMATEEEIDLRIKKTKLLVDNVNSLIKSELEDVDKEDFFDYIKLEVPPSKANHIKYRQAIIDTLKELQTLDIKNAMASGNDILGKFYQNFLSYGNGAKEIGIVLTPRHITKFSVEVLDIKHNDYLLDPACGTGGFLVSAFDYIKNNSNTEQLEKFKNYGMFGIEQDDEVVALALANMIFRGDGRNNLREGNCFQYSILKTQKGGNTTGKYDHSLNVLETKKNKKGEEKSYVKEIKQNPSPVITKVLMNPPFSLKKGDEKERHFIDFGLSQMEDGGTLFAILPISVLVEKEGKRWREELLRKNTLLAVLTFPPDLFEPSASVGTVGIFIKKGIQHDFDKQKVFFARTVNDGFKVKKAKRLRNIRTPDQLSQIKEELKSFLANQNTPIKNVPEFKKVCLLDKKDCKADENGKIKGNVELVAEAYLDNRIPSLQEIEKGVEEIIKEVVAFKIKYEGIIKNDDDNRKSL